MGSYGLLIAFVESAAVTLLVIILGLLISIKWDENRRIALLCFLVFVTVSWSIIGQLYFILEVNFPISWGHILTSSSHPLWILYGISLGAVGITVALPSLIILRKPKAAEIITKIIEPLTTLTALYLFLDVIALIIVITRNL